MNEDECFRLAVYGRSLLPHVGVSTEDVGLGRKKLTQTPIIRGTEHGSCKKTEIMKLKATQNPKMKWISDEGALAGE